MSVGPPSRPLTGSWVRSPTSSDSARSPSRPASSSIRRMPPSCGGGSRPRWAAVSSNCRERWFLLAVLAASPSSRTALGPRRSSRRHAPLSMQALALPATASTARAPADRSMRTCRGSRAAWMRQTSKQDRSQPRPSPLPPARSIGRVPADLHITGLEMSGIQRSANCLLLARDGGLAHAQRRAGRSRMPVGAL
jgi:hypothetical protein